MGNFEAVLLPGVKPDALMDQSMIVNLMNRTVPHHAFRPNQRAWTWTRPGGLWHLNLVMHTGSDGAEQHLKARLDGTPCFLQCSVRLTRREINALLRWLVLVEAIDRHPDDPIAARAVEG